MATTIDVQVTVDLGEAVYLAQCLCFGHYEFMSDGTASVTRPEMSAVVDCLMMRLTAKLQEHHPGKAKTVRQFITEMRPDATPVLVLQKQDICVVSRRGARIKVSFPGLKASSLERNRGFDLQAEIDEACMVFDLESWPFDILGQNVGVHLDMPYILRLQPSMKK